MTHALLTQEDLSDPIVEEVRRIKHQLADSYPDFHSMCEDIRKRQFDSGHIVMTRAADGKFVPVTPTAK